MAFVGALGLLLATRNHIIYGCSKVPAGKGCVIVFLDTPRTEKPPEAVVDAEAKADLPTIRDTPSPTKKLK